jgi:hypothetical protein
LSEENISDGSGREYAARAGDITDGRQGKSSSERVISGRAETSNIKLQTSGGLGLDGMPNAGLFLPPGFFRRYAAFRGGERNRGLKAPAIVFRRDAAGEQALPGWRTNFS